MTKRIFLLISVFTLLSFFQPQKVSAKEKVYLGHVYNGKMKKGVPIEYGKIRIGEFVIWGAFETNRIKVTDFVLDSFGKYSGYIEFDESDTITLKSGGVISCRVGYKDTSSLYYHTQEKPKITYTSDLSDTISTDIKGSKNQDFSCLFPNIKYYVKDIYNPSMSSYYSTIGLNSISELKCTYPLIKKDRYYELCDKGSFNVETDEGTTMRYVVQGKDKKPLLIEYKDTLGNYWTAEYDEHGYPDTLIMEVNLGNGRKFYGASGVYDMENGRIKLDNGYFINTPSQNPVNINNSAYECTFKDFLDMKAGKYSSSFMDYPIWSICAPKGKSLRSGIQEDVNNILSQNKHHPSVDIYLYCDEGRSFLNNKISWTWLESTSQMYTERERKEMVREQAIERRRQAEAEIRSRLTKKYGAKVANDYMDGKYIGLPIGVIEVGVSLENKYYDLYHKYDFYKTDLTIEGLLRYGGNARGYIQYFGNGCGRLFIVKNGKVIHIDPYIR